MIKQSALPFKLDITNDEITANAGLVLFGEFMAGLNVGGMLDKSVRPVIDNIPLGGLRILGLCADMVMEVVSEHIKPLESLRHGQILWMGVSIDDPPSRDKRIADTDLVPLVLDLCVDDDI